MASSRMLSGLNFSQRLLSVSVIGGFLDGVRLDFTEGLNCIIGGRGTGKTTMLEFIRYAFDALPSRDDAPEERNRIEKLVEQNLAGGRVQVAFQTKNGLSYIVSRTWGDAPVVTTGDGQATQLTLRSGSVFRADIYSQNEVERIAEQTASQLVLIDRFKPEEIAAIEGELRELTRQLASNATQLLSLERAEVELRDEVAMLPEVEEKLKAFTDSEDENADVINEAHAAKALRDQERLALDSIDEDLASLRNELDSHRGWLAARTQAHLDAEISAGPNGELLASLADTMASCSQSIDGLLQQAGAMLDEAAQKHGEVSETLIGIHGRQELAFRALIEQHATMMEQATERAQLERERAGLLAKKRELEDLSSRLETARGHRTALLSSLSEQRDRRFSVRQGVAEEINARVSPLIRIGLEQFGEVTEYCRLLASALKRAGVQHNVVAQKLASSIPPRDLIDLVKARDSHGLMDQARLNSAQAEKVIESLNDSETFFELESVELDDRPRIELLDGDAYKESTAISTGQKCTSILPILLLDSDRPLLVDQPEDNLDNGFIYDTVVTRLDHIRGERQLIFVTHNPNIPVLGDASRVFVLKSSGVKAWVETEGSVDDCRSAIITLLEGGEEAFKRRQERYEY